jgi:hypothetical protein
VPNPGEFDFCSILNWDYNPDKMMRA